MCPPSPHTYKCNPHARKYIPILETYIQVTAHTHSTHITAHVTLPHTWLLQSFPRSLHSISYKQHILSAPVVLHQCRPSALCQWESLSDACCAASGTCGPWLRRSRNLAPAPAQRVLPRLYQLLCEPQARPEKGGWDCPSHTLAVSTLLSLSLPSAVCVLPIMLQCWKAAGHMMPQITWSREWKTLWGTGIRTLAFSWWESVSPVGFFQNNILLVWSYKIITSPPIAPSSPSHPPLLSFKFMTTFSLTVVMHMCVLPKCINIIRSICITLPACMFSH